MAPEKHAMLGASKAHQWLECTPSAKWETQFEESLRSEAAAEGTLAHALAEHYLRSILDGKKPRVPKAIREDSLFHPAMVEHVQTYVDYILETQSQLITYGSVETKIEQHVEFDSWVPGGFGTCDCLMVSDKHLHIFDFKYGKGVPVSAISNPQLRLYALGAINELGILYGFDTVTMHIIQPRLDSITSDTVKVEDLIEWAETVVRPKAELASKGEGEFVAGDHCRFCKCKNVCRAYADKQLEVAKSRFTPEGVERLPNELSMDEVAKVLESVDELASWAKSIKDWALDQCANHGTHIPGWKLVEGRANRRITDETVAFQKLESAGYTSDRITKLIGITDLERLVGAKALKELLGDLIIKPSGKPVLAPESDKRPAISTTDNARTVFTSIED